MKFLFFSLIIVLFFVVSCEKEESINVPELDDEIITLVEDEIMADINFAELLDEGDNGLFWGDAGFSSLKSAEVVKNDCRKKLDTIIENRRIVTLNFNDGSCGKSGIIIIEYHKKGNYMSNGEKNITFIDFKNTEGTKFNGIKNIRRGNGNYNIKAEMKIAKWNGTDSVHITRNYNRQVHWECGLETRNNRDDNIKRVSGKSEITRTVNGKTKAYSRKILKPLLIVKECGLKIQAGTVKVERPNGIKVKINYGDMPEDYDCDTDWIYEDDAVGNLCNTTVEITKGDEVFEVTFDENGMRIKKSDDNTNE